MFWVISVYFNIRNILPKSGTFLLGHLVYMKLKAFNELCFILYTMTLLSAGSVNLCLFVLAYNSHFANHTLHFYYYISISLLLHYYLYSKNALPLFPHNLIYIYIHTRVGTFIVATIYLQLIQNRYMFRSFTVLQCSHHHCVQPVASDVEVVGYL